VKAARPIFEEKEHMGEKNEPATMVAHRVTAVVWLPGEPALPLPAKLGYDVADPYAVRLSLGTPEMQQIDWVFARSLLEEGMNQPAGVGNVRVIPPHQAVRNFVRIVVRSTTGTAQIDVLATEAREFLRRSHALVPAGAESLHIDLDCVLASLIDSCD
jgi:hypothetical protein